MVYVKKVVVVKVNGKMKKVIIVLVIFAFGVIGLGLFILMKDSNTSKKSNEYIEDVVEYSDNISIDNIKGDKNKALYLVLSQTHKTSDNYSFLKKESGKFIFREKFTDVCYEVNLDDFLVNTVINCTYEVNK